MLKALVFDFDGTLADTFQAVIDSVNEVHEQYRYEPIHDTRNIRNKPFYETIRHELQIPFYKIPSFYRKVRNIANERFLAAELFPEIADMLKALGKEFSIIILSSNKENTVQELLEEHNVYVDRIIADVPLFGKSRALTSLVETEGIRTHEILYIGDELRDIRACKRARVAICAVTWGFHSKHVLRKGKPDFLVDTPSELVQLTLALADRS